MSAPGLDDTGQLALPGGDHGREMLERRQERFARQQRRADVDGCRDRVVAALPHVHVVVGVDARRRPRGEMRDHFVRIHVAAGARARLKYVNGELAIVRAAGHCRGRGADRRGEPRVEQAQFGIGLRRRLLDQRQGANEGSRQRATADRKIIDGALRLGAPERIGGHLELTHAVAFQPESVRTHGNPDSGDLHAAARCNALQSGF